MKKFVSCLLALTLMLVGLTACAQQGAAPSDPDSVAYRLAGLDPAAALLTIDGREVPAEMYLYWLQYAATVASGTSGCTDEEGNLLWDHEMEDGVTVLDYVLDEALRQAKTYIEVEKFAQEYGVELSEEEEAGVDEEIAYYIEQLGGQESYDAYLDQIGISADTNRRLTRDYYLYSKLLELTKTEGSDLYITDEMLYQYDGITEETVLVDHVLFLTSDDEEDNKTRYETMEQVRQSLLEAEGEQRVSMFNYIANYYSEDTGRTYYPNGYLVTADANFVQPFKDAALSLEENALSEIVTSEYGYHLLLRKPLRDYVAADYLEERLQEAIDAAQVDYSAAFESLDPQAYYTAYRAELDAAAAAEESAESGESEDSEDSAESGESGTEAPAS